MKRIILIMMALALLVGGISIAVQAQALRNTDVQWGFDYRLGVGADQGDMRYWFQIHEDHNRWNITRRGAYTDPGPSVQTTIGARLGANYSPYVAWFQQDQHDNRTRGVRVRPFPIGPFNLDAVMVLATSTTNKPRDIGSGDPDFDLGFRLDGSIDSIDLDIALARESNWDSGENIYDVEYAYAIDTKFNLPMNMILNPIYAGYTKGDLSLIHVKYNWEVRRRVLEVRAEYRDSDAEWGAAATRPAWTDDHPGSNYVLQTLVNRGEGYAVGATTWLEPIPSLIMELRADYDTRIARGSDDDKITLGLDSEYLGYTVDQTLTVVSPGNIALNKAEYVYTLRSQTPTYRDVMGISGLNSYGRVDTDITIVPGSEGGFVLDEMHNRVFGHLEKEVDLPYLPGVMLSGRALYETHNNETIEDPLKFAFQADYRAPNRVRFNFIYYTTTDWFSSNPTIRGRRQSYQFYDDDVSSQYTGLRIQVTF